MVAKGYEQEQAVYLNETFAPVVKIQSLRLLISIAVNEGLKIHHIDISTAFLYRELTEEVYIDIPDGVEVVNKTNTALKLNKALQAISDTRYPLGTMN